MTCGCVYNGAVTLIDSPFRVNCHAHHIALQSQLLSVLPRNAATWSRPGWTALGLGLV